MVDERKKMTNFFVALCERVERRDNSTESTEFVGGTEY
jgi:hypothetical protein